MSPNTEIIKEITDLTMKIRNEHPELYARLEEAPITLSSGTSNDVREELENYRDTLLQMLDKKKGAENSG